MTPRKPITEREELQRLLILLALCAAVVIGALVFGDRGEASPAPVERGRCEP